MEDNKKKKKAIPAKYRGCSVHKVKGHKGFRGKIQIGKRRYVRYFKVKRADEAMEACYFWRLSKINELKDRPTDGSKTWGYLKEKYVYFMKHKINKKTGRPAYRPRTIEEYGYCFKRFEAISKVNYLNDITVKTILQLRKSLEDEAMRKEVDNYGANKVLRCLLVALKWGIDRGIVENIPIDAISLLEVSEVEVNSFPTRQIELLLKYSPPKWRVAILLSFDGGCRPEEVYSLLVEKLDLKEGFADISPNLEDKKRGIIAWYPKRDKERLVRLSPRTIAEIKALKPKGPYLITGRWGEPYTEDNFSQKFAKHVQAVNRKIVEKESEAIKIVGTFKMLRKNYVTDLQAQGSSEEEAASGAGHSDKKVTKKNYTDKKNEALKKKWIKEEKEKLIALDKYLTPLNY